MIYKALFMHGFIAQLAEACVLVLDKISHTAVPAACEWFVVA